MTPRWTIQATTFEGGFSLRLKDSDARDLGAMLRDLDAPIVRMEDGRVMSIFQALATMINGRVTEITVTTELSAEDRLFWPVTAGAWTETFQ